jgi:diguanylate cyclase (GGDEF)-like protein
MATSNAVASPLGRARAFNLRTLDPVPVVLLTGVPVLMAFFVLTAMDFQGQIVLWENAHWTISAAIAVALAAVGTVCANADERPIRKGFLLAAGVYFVGQVAWNLQAAVNHLSVPALSDIFYLAGGALAARTLLQSVRGKSSAIDEVAIYIDALAVFVAISTLVVSVFGVVANTAGLAGVVLLLYPIAFLATAGAGLVVALATRVPFAAKGTYAVLGGFALLGLAWGVWVSEALTAFPPPGSGMNYLFSVATVVFGYGAATWTPARDDRATAVMISGAVRAALSAAAVLSGVGVLIFWSAQEQQSAWGVSAGAAVLTLLPLLRQWLLARENQRAFAREKVAGERERRAREEALDALRSQQESELRYRSVVDVHNRLAERISFATGDAELVTATRSALSRLVPSEAGNALLLNSSRDHLIVAAAWGDRPLVLDTVAPLDRPVRCPGIRRGSPYQVVDASDDLAPGCPGIAATEGSTLCVPMLALGQVVGVIHLARAEQDAFDADSQYQASRVAEQTALALANARLVNTMEGLAMTDSLTGLHNARFFDPVLDRELTASKREGHPTGVIMIDLDHFKRFNDSYGHPAGDLALKAFASAVLGQLRDSDTAARYGGEEFVVAVRNTDLAGTMQVAENIREAVSRTVVELGPGRFGRITVSAGVANTILHGHDRMALLRLADAALYRAKQDGRDRVVGADSVGFTAGSAVPAPRVTATVRPLAGPRRRSRASAGD